MLLTFSTKENFAVIFTKILDKATFEHLRDQIMLPYNPDKIWEGENEFTASTGAFYMDRVHLLFRVDMNIRNLLNRSS